MAEKKIIEDKDVSRNIKNNFTLLNYRSSEGSSSQEQLASESSTPEQPNSVEYSLDIENTVENCIDEPATIQINHKNIEQGQSDRPKSAEPVTKYESSGSSTTDRQTATATVVAVNEIDNMKRAHAKQLIERYFYQLSTGCGNPHCTNKNCASSHQFETLTAGQPLTPNQAAARAIQLFSEDAKFCDFPANKSARISSDATDSHTEPSTENSPCINDPGFDDTHR